MSEEADPELKPETDPPEPETKPDTKTSAPTSDVIYAELEKVIKINRGESIVDIPALPGTIKKAVEMLYEKYNTEGAKAAPPEPAPAAADGVADGVADGDGAVDTSTTKDGAGGPPPTEVATENIAAAADQTETKGGRRRSKRKGRKGSRKSRKGRKGGKKQQQQSQSSQNGGRRSRRNHRKYSRRSKH